MTVVDDKDHDAFNFVKFRVLKPRVVDARNRPEPKLKCGLCGDGPFINHFKVVQHKIDRCPRKGEQENWNALAHGVNHMSFEIALVEDIYKRLDEAYILNIENLKRLYKNEKIATYRRKLNNKKKREFSTECIVCTMTWPCETRICLENADQFILHNVDHILKNRLEDIRSHPSTPRNIINNASGLQPENIRSSDGTTPMKKPKGLGRSRSVNEKPADDGGGGIEVHEMLELHTNQADKNFLRDQKLASNQESKNNKKT